MPRSRIGFIMCVLLALAAVVSPLPEEREAHAQADGEDAASVAVVVLAPYVTWDDIEALPVLSGLAERSALADVNTRSRVAGPSEADLTGAAMMLSAGSWTTQRLRAPGAYSLHEDYETGEVAEAYRRFMGRRPEDAAIAYLGFPVAARANEFDTLQTEIGLLGRSVREADGLTAAIGNSDAGYAVTEVGKNRPAAIAAMDEAGLVARGDVSRRMLVVDENGPFGLSTDLELLAEVYRGVMGDIAGSSGPGLVVLDPGDLHRALEFSDVAAPSVAERHRRNALATLDAVVGVALEALPDDGVLLVYSLVPPPVEGPDPLAPIVASGPGFEAGMLTSDSTHREGMVTNLDVTATLLERLGLERPTAVLGNPARAVPGGGSLHERSTFLSRRTAAAVAVEQAKPEMLNTFIAVGVLVLVVAGLVVLRGGAPVWLVGLLKAVLLFVAAFPVGTYLMFLVRRFPDSGWEVAGLAIAATLAVWAVAGFVAVRWGGVVAVAGVCLLTVAVVILDPWIGSPLSLVGLLSSSPLGAARYYGLGNEAAGLVAGSLVIGLGLAADVTPKGVSDAVRRWVVPVIGGLAVFTLAAPSLGANVGVAVWGVVLVAALWAGMNGVRISFKLVAAVLGAAAALIAALAFLDVGGGSQTHLGRAIQSALEGGAGELWIIVARKAEANIRVLTHTNWTFLLIAVLGFLAYMRWRPRGEFLDMLERHPYLGDALTAALLGGFVAYFTEDSGIIIPALMFIYVGVGTLYVLLEHLRTEEGPGA